MKIIKIKKRSEGCEDLLKTTPTKIVGTLVDEPTILYEGDKPLLGYFFLPESLLRDLRKVSRGVKLTKNHRTSGLPTQSVVLGVMPRHPSMNNYCRFTKQSQTEKQNFAVLLNALEHCSELYQKYFPDNYKNALAQVQSSVDKTWRYNDTPYLTINVNVNHAIKYHRDTGNFSGPLSTVLIVKNNILGGELCIPEVGLTLSQRDGALTLFDGQSLMHGVKPIKATATGAMRASIVFYSMSNLKHCYPFVDEWQRFQKISTAKARGATGNDRKLVLAIAMKSGLTKKLGVDGYKKLLDKIKNK